MDMTMAVCAVAVAALAVAVAAVLWRRRRGAVPEEYDMLPAPVVRYATKFGPMRVFQTTAADGRAMRVMELGGAYQSATFLGDDCYELTFEYYKLYDLMFSAGVPVRRVLMLGGGGYAWPKHAISSLPQLQLDVVEADPDVTSIARRWFYLDRLWEEFDLDETGRLRVVHADAREHLDALAGGDGGAAARCPAPASATAPPDPAPTGRYDAIANDCFAGRRPAMSLATVEAARAVRACLVPGGVYLTNAISALSGEGAWFLDALVTTLRQVFAHVYVVPCARFGEEDRDNNMVVACDRALVLPGAVAYEPSAAVEPLRDATVADYVIPVE